ncbi:MAG: bacillithiol biosynthesis BshC, partial [Saprospiraceae bacterium]|nr:bacillithiol biosynthesis BshC [Saprospiraceae bacterium]
MINKQILPFEQAPQLAKSDIAYTTGDARLQEFYLYEPATSSFAEILLRKEQAEYPRTDLVAALKKQYATLPSIPIVDNNINALSDSNTFTIVTAHQPSLFLGPMYFIYKALSVIKLADTVQKRAGDKRKIVPVFVMGSEDHDLEELNKIRLFGKQIEWQPGETGPVGIMRSETLAAPLAELKGILGDSDAAQTLYERVERACLGRPTFAEATQALLHEFLGRLGIVVLDMNEPTLKRHLIPVMRDELLSQHAHSIVNATIARLTNA